MKPWVALGAGVAALVFTLGGERLWGGLVAAGAVAWLWGARKGLTLRPNSATLDHVVPHSRGGIDDPSNTVTACWSCNRAKSNRTPEEWRAGVVVDSTARERASIPVDARLAVYTRDNWTCRYCGVDVS